MFRWFSLRLLFVPLYSRQHVQDVPGARTIRYPDRVALYASPQPLSCTLSTCATLLAATRTVVGPVNNSLPGGQIHSSTSTVQHSKLLESPLTDKCTVRNSSAFAEQKLGTYVSTSSRAARCVFSTQLDICKSKVKVKLSLNTSGRRMRNCSTLPLILNFGSNGRPVVCFTVQRKCLRYSGMHRRSGHTGKKLPTPEPQSLVCPPVSVAAIPIKLYQLPKKGTERPWKMFLVLCNSKYDSKIFEFCSKIPITAVIF